MESIILKTPVDGERIDGLRAGDRLRLSGNILVARDQAHIRINEMIREGKSLPFELEGQAIYYAGPSPTRPGEVVGSIGPTTAARMDDIAEPLFTQGVRLTIGKGERSASFRELVMKYKAPYLAAMGGCGAVVQEAVTASKCLAFEELGPEAVYRLTIKEMPVFVAYDIHGGSIYNR